MCIRDRLEYAATEGEARGEARGEAKAKRAMILRLSRQGVDLKVISTAADMSIEEVRKIISTSGNF